jgi:hypothetical protein
MLRTIASLPGRTLPDTARAGQEWEAIQKKVQRTSQSLRKHLGITGDPFPYFENVGYRSRIRFKVSEK